ncbi:MAG: hypothetical protein ABI999_09855 [Acidobacteriota bacterium]
MLIRAIALSLALLIGIGAIIPLATETTEAGPRHHRKYRSHHRHYKKYSRAWWKQFHTRQRRRKALAARRRALRLQQIRLAKSGESSTPGAVTKGVRSTPVKADESVALLPTGDAAPQGWKRTGTGPGELQFRVDNSSGSQIGSAAISVVGSAMGESGDRGRASFVGGVPTTSLRRDVINRMVRENGWVVNDYQKDVSGKKVYVVVAQSQASGGRVQSRMFYFTEVDGRIYSVATNASTDDAERLAEESEKVLNSLARVRPQQQAAVKE